MKLKFSVSTLLSVAFVVATAVSIGVLLCTAVVDHDVVPRALVWASGIYMLVLLYLGRFVADNSRGYESFCNPARFGCDCRYHDLD